MKKSVLYIVLILVGFISFTAQGQQSNVKGKLKDENGAPIAGAQLTADDSTGTKTTSADDGSFTFANLTPPVKIKVSASGYEPYVIEYTGSETNLEIVLQAQLKESALDEVLVTSRRREEVVQDIPIPITVIGGKLADDAGAFNVNRLKELVPSVQLYSSNPRNTGLNIRGLGSSYGLTNDGLDPGVGFYVDGVYYARPAATTLDFIDIQRIEVLRGPQGTLFGKNTTAGAFNIITRKPTFKPGANFETSTGNFGFLQAKASVTGPLIKGLLAARLSISGTKRNGVIENVRTGEYINTLDNQGVRAQLLFTPSDKLEIILAGDFSQQRPVGYAQVLAGVVPTQRAAFRQFNSIISDLNYTPASYNAFDRKIDHDTPWRSGNDLGGTSLNIDWKIGPGTLTSTTAWRYWNWDPSNDRDFTGLQALAKSQNPSKQQQWSQEIRYAATFSNKLSGVIGVFAMGQDVTTRGTEESGNAQWRFSQSSTSALWATPGLFEGYGIKTYSNIKSFTGAAFAQVDWNVFKGLHVLPGIRYNYDQKDVKFDRQTYGGLQTNNSALLALKRQVYSDQAYTTSIDESNISGNLTVSYKFSSKLNAFATYAKSYKPVGVNVAGLPTVNGQPALDLSVIKPENVNHVEFGIKTTPFKRSTFNVTVFNSDIKNYQTQVQAAELGVNRGYLANAEGARVRGVEADFNLNPVKYLAVYGAVTYTEGIYTKFTNAPLPLEETGAAVAFKDISGQKLPGISKWAGSLGAELSTKETKFLGHSSNFFLAIESSGRTKFSSSPTPSRYLNINEYALVNARIGFRASEGLTFFIWGRNVLDKNYFEQLLPAGGGAGHYAGVVGDPRTFGATLRYTIK